MISLTLTYSGTEKFLADWGYSEPFLHLEKSLSAPSTFTVQCPGGDPAGAEDIPKWGVVTIRMGRTYSGGVFSGGSIIFVGRRTDFGRIAQPDNSQTMRVFSDPWYDLQEVVFQHYWKYWTGSAYANFYFSRLNLFQDISAGPDNPWTYLTTYGQILEILTYAASAGANVQTGTVDPTWTVPAYGVKAISCAEALQICTKPMADVCKYFDYTLSPPKLHIRQRGNLAAQTLPFAGTSGSRSHVSSSIKSRPDLQPPGVSIQYMTTSTVDDETKTNFVTDTYPVGVDPKQMGAMIIPIDLRGGVTRNVTGKVVSVACDPTTWGFWQDHKKELKPYNATTNPQGTVTNNSVVNTGINDGTLYGITIQDQGGNNVSLSDFPYEMLDGGDLASWMKSGSTSIVARSVTVKGWLKYEVLNPKDASNTLHQLQVHEVSCNIKLTNSVPAGVDGGGRPLPTKYAATATYSSGDPSISGLAQNVYTSMATLQWEGEHVITDPELAGGLVDIAKNLNLSGGASDWTSMAADVSKVTVDFTRGIQTVDFGPHQHLSAAQFVEYLLMWRYRSVYENPSVRSDGHTSNSTDVILPEDEHVRDTTSNPPNYALHTITAPQTDTGGLPDAQIRLDAQAISNLAGLMGTGSGLTPAQRVIQPKKQQICVNGNKMYVVVLSGPVQTA